MSRRLLVAAAAGYAIGSIPTALWVARRHGVNDLRDVGDRNPGAWNALQTLGRRAAWPVFVGDTAKGVVAAGIGRATSRHWIAPYLTGGAAMVGHAFPATAGFRGGRSVLTFVGTAVVAAPASAAVGAGVFGTTWAVTGRFDLGARTGVAAFPFIQLVVDGPRRTAASGMLMTFVGARFAQAALAERRSRGRTTPQAVAGGTASAPPADDHAR